MRATTLHAGPLARQAIVRLDIETPGRGFVEITDAVVEAVAEAGIGHGLVTVFCRHSSASLAIQENADPDVVRDLGDALDRLAPRDARYRHGAEGPDDMPAHIRAMLTGASLAVPIVEGRPALGTWQGVWLVEHRDRPHRRSVLIVAQGA